MTNNVLLLLIIFMIIFVPVLSFAQSQQRILQHEYQVVKTKNNERFVLPFTAPNSDRKNPIVYVYDKPKITNWILTIQNNLSYAIRQDAKAIVILKEPPPSEKFIEIAMFSDVSKKFWAAINTYAGNISFDVAFGELTNSPIYYLPLGMLVGVGGTVVVFLVVKKRDKSQN